MVDSPTDLIESPLDPAVFYVAERDGRVVRFDLSNHPLTSEVALDLRARTDQTGEGGLLGLATHPDFAINGKLYLSYTVTGDPLESRISGFQSADGGVSFEDVSEDILISLPQPGRNHNGGTLAFDRAGMLLVSFGDGGNAGGRLAQDPSNFFGTIVRIDVDLGSPYAIPADNPFAAGGGAPEVYAYGLRNPYRFAVDQLTGDVWVGDVGDGSWEEIDLLQAGANYGWPVREGRHCRGGGECNSAGLTEPVYEYDHSEGCAIVGGTVYRGAEVPALSGRYLYSDFCSARVFAVDFERPGGPAATEVVAGPGFVFSLAEDNAGEVYFLSNRGIFQIPEPATPGAAVPTLGVLLLLGRGRK